MATTDISSHKNFKSYRSTLESGTQPPDDGGMEARVAKLETTVEYIQRDVAELRADVKGIRTTDFRLIFGAIITVALGLAALMAHGFHWL